MDSLPKLMRVKFSSFAKNQENAYDAREGRILPQKTASFDKERKKTKTWFQQQFSKRKSEEDAYLELPVAVAAAAYAIMLDEEKAHLHKKPIEELGSSLPKIKSRREDSMNISTVNNNNVRWFDVDDGRIGGNSFKRKSSTLAESMQEEFAVDLKKKEKALTSNPNVTKAPTSSDKYLSGTGKKPFDHHEDMKTKQNVLPTNASTPSYSTNGFHNGDKKLTKAYDREQAKMEKIRKRHQKMSNTILQWETEKKVKAKRRMERKERDLEMRRVKILQEFREKMARIDMIGSGARTVADDERRREELKAKEKTKMMRSPVKIQHKCFCF